MSVFMVSIRVFFDSLFRFILIYCVNYDIYNIIFNRIALFSTVHLAQQITYLDTIICKLVFRLNFLRDKIFEMPAV